LKLRNLVKLRFFKLIMTKSILVT